MKPAVFLDRDGTIIELVHHLNRPEDVALIAGSGPAIKALADAGYLIVVVTNQSVIGRGKLTVEGLAEVHAEMNTQLAAFDAKVNAIYFAPQKPQQSDPEVIEHPMRKPGPGMLQQAVQDHDIDLALSWMVGDTIGDLCAGKNAGCRSLLVETGYGHKVPHDHHAAHAVCSDLSAVASFIIDANEV